MSEGLGPVELQISEWVRNHVVGHKYTCTHLILRHTNLSQSPDGDVKQVRIPTDRGLVGEVELIVGQVAEAAQQDANSIGGTVQQYALYAYYKDDQNYVPRRYFRVAPDTSYSEGAGPTETPTEKGMAAQAMRHLEAMTRLNVGSQTSLFSMLNNTINKLQAQNDSYAKQQVDLFLLMQATLNESHGRRLAERKEEASLAMREDMLTYLKAAMPVLINRLAGNAVLPEDHRSFMLMASLLESLTPEQQEFLKESLQPKQLTVLAEVLGEYEKQKAKFGDEALRAQLAEEPEKVPEKTRRGSSRLAAVPESPAPRPPRMFSTLRDRLSEMGKPSNDPVIQEIEKHGKNFTSRLVEAQKKPPEEG